MGIKKVVYLHSYARYKGLAIDEGIDFLARFGVEVAEYKGRLAHLYPDPHSVGPPAVSAQTP